MAAHAPCPPRTTARLLLIALLAAASLAPAAGGPALAADTPAVGRLPLPAPRSGGTGAALSLAPPAAAPAQPAAAAAARPEGPPPLLPVAVSGGARADAAVLGRINTYFNAIRTMSGDFVQFSPGGARAEGSFVIAKPGRILFRYAPPSKLLIVSDGKSVSVRDRRRDGQDIWPLEKTPLRLLLSDRIDLTRDAKVTSATVQDGLVTIELTEKTVFGIGRLIMVFDERTGALKQWTVIDAQNQETSVAIYNTRTGIPVDPNWFKINYVPVR